jgi:hypothetical protein
VLSRALDSLAGGGGGTGGGGGAAGLGGGGSGPGGSGPLLTPSTPADTKALQTAGQQGDQPVKVGEDAIVPGATGLATGAPRTGLPALLIAVLALLGAAALGGGAPLVRRCGGWPALTALPKRVLRR